MAAPSTSKIFHREDSFLVELLDCCMRDSSITFVSNAHPTVDAEVGRRDFLLKHSGTIDGYRQQRPAEFYNRAACVTPKRRDYTITAVRACAVQWTPVGPGARVLFA